MESLKAEGHCHEVQVQNITVGVSHQLKLLAPRGQVLGNQATALGALISKA